MPKFIQIQTCADGEGNVNIHGLTEDGEIWEFCGQHRRDVTFPGYGDTPAMTVYALFCPGWHKLTQDMAKPIGLDRVLPPEGTSRVMDNGRGMFEAKIMNGIDRPIATEKEKEDFMAWVEFQANRGRR